MLWRQFPPSLVSSIVNLSGLINYPPHKAPVNISSASKIELVKRVLPSFYVDIRKSIRMLADVTERDAAKLIWANLVLRVLPSRKYCPVTSLKVSVFWNGSRKIIVSKTAKFVDPVPDSAIYEAVNVLRRSELIETKETEGEEFIRRRVRRCRKPVFGNFKWLSFAICEEDRKDQNDPISDQSAQIK